MYSCLPLFDPHCTWLFCPPYSESVTVTHQDSSNIYQTCCSKAINLLILKACPAACWINDGVKLIQVFQAWNKGSSKEIWHAWHMLTDIYIDCVWEAICCQLQMVWWFKRQKDKGKLKNVAYLWDVQIFFYLAEEIVWRDIFPV